MEQQGFFDTDTRLQQLSELGDPLERLNETIDWQLFRPALNKIFKKEAKGPGGRPPFDYVMMFKILVLQKLYHISDAQAQYQINDRLSFMRFLGLKLYETVPDEKTIWHFREQLVTSKKMDTLYYRFVRALEEKGIITYTGSIIDATFVDAPKQRNTRDENAEIKNDTTPDEWNNDDQKHKKSQKDVDARWTRKNDETHYGYKDHIKIDSDSKLITSYTVTPANVHDSQELSNLIDIKKDNVVYADSAYSGKDIESCLGNIENRIHEKGYRNKPLTKRQMQRNRKKSKTRARVEHVFAFMTNTMKGITVRSIGIARAQVQIALINLTYNLCRYTYLANANG
jgi:transposase, IS5 family